MTTTTDISQLARQIREVLPQFGATLDGMTPEQLDYKPAPAEWSARQVAYHMADAHSLMSFRIRAGLTEDVPTTPRWEINAFAELPDTTGPVEDALLTLYGVHGRLSRLAEQLTEDQLARKVITIERPDRTVLEWLETIVKHTLNHIGQVNDVRAAQGLARVEPTIQAG